MLAYVIRDGHNPVSFISLNKFITFGVSNNHGIHWDSIWGWHSWENITDGFGLSTFWLHINKRALFFRLNYFNERACNVEASLQTQFNMLAKITSLGKTPEEFITSNISKAPSLLCSEHNQHLLHSTKHYSLSSNCLNCFLEWVLMGSALSVHIHDMSASPMNSLAWSTRDLR